MEEDIVDKYIEWVTNKIDLLQSYAKSIQKPDVNIHDLKEILSQRLNVSLILNAEYQRFKIMHRSLKEEYQVFWDEKYTILRRTLNPTSLASGKWISKSEIESEVRYSYKDEYLKYKKRLNDLEDRASFLKRIMSQWESISFDVANYTKLIETEVYGLNNMSATETVRRRTRER